MLIIPHLKSSRGGKIGWYEALKDGISVAQKADNLQLVRDLLEAQQQIFDLVNENNQLKEEIKRLNEVVDIEANIESVFWARSPLHGHLAHL